MSGSTDSCDDLPGILDVGSPRLKRASTGPALVAFERVTPGLANSVSEDLRADLKSIHTKLDELKSLIQSRGNTRTRTGASCATAEGRIPIQKATSVATGHRRTSRTVSENSSACESGAFSEMMGHFAKATLRRSNSVSQIQKVNVDSPMPNGAPRKDVRMKTTTSNGSLQQITDAANLSLKDVLVAGRSNARTATMSAQSSLQSSTSSCNSNPGPSAGAARRPSRMIPTAVSTALFSLDPSLSTVPSASGDGESNNDSEPSGTQDAASDAGQRKTLRKRTEFLTSLWNLLEVPESGKAAFVLSEVMPWFIISTVVISLAQSVEEFHFDGVAAAVVETTIDGIFMIEFALRFLACPNHYTFFKNVFNHIDLLSSAIPLAIRAFAGFELASFEVKDVTSGLLLCAVPMVRFMKLLRRFETFHLLLDAFTLAAKALPVIFFILAAITLFFTMIIYVVEPSDNVGSLPLAAWLTIVTMSTVGYGDYSPTSPAGMATTGVLIVVSVLYTAIPLGIVGNAFTETWKDRDRILLKYKTRDRLKEWGYTAHDIPMLFQMLDENGDSRLTLDEFTELLKLMQLGFNDARIVQLFKLFEPDEDGCVDERKFVQTLFPHAYSDLYCNLGGSSNLDSKQSPVSLH